MKQFSVDPVVGLAVGTALAMDIAGLGFADFASVFGASAVVVKFALVVAGAGLSYLAVALNLRTPTP